MASTIFPKSSSGGENTKVLRKHELVGRMMAWLVELSEFDIWYEPKGPIKTQHLADFINELHLASNFSKQWWTLHVDNSFN